MKIIYLLLFLLISTKCYCQDPDTDGDGIPDKVEKALSKRYLNQNPYSTYYNYLISDFPQVAIRFSNLNIGIRFSLTSSTSETATLSHTQDNTTSATVSKKTYNTESVSNALTLDVKAGYGIGGLSGGVSMEDQFKTTSENGFNFTKEDIDQYKQAYSQIQTQISSHQVSFSSQDGYATSTMYFYNPDPVRTIRISNVRIHVLQFDMATGVVSDQSIIPDLTVNLTASTVGANSSFDQSLNYLDLPSQTPVPVNFFVDKINSFDIDNLIKNNKSLIFEVVNFDLKITDSKLSPLSPIVYSSHNDDIENNCFKLRIIDSAEDRNISIAKIDSNNNPMTIRKALEALYPNKNYIKFGSLMFNGKNITYVKQLGDFESNLDLSVKPEDFSNENKKQGFWFVLTNYGKELYKDIDDPIVSNLNAHLKVSLIYIKGIDLLNKNYSIVDAKSIEVGMDQNIINTGLSISSNNLIELKINSQSSTYSAVTNKVFMSIQKETFHVGFSTVSLGPIDQYTIKENWQSNDDITDLNKLHFSFYINQIPQEFSINDCKIIEKHYLNDTLFLILKLKTNVVFNNSPLTLKSYYNNFNYGQIQLQQGYDHSAISTLSQTPLGNQGYYVASTATINGQNINDILRQSNFTIQNIKKKASVWIAVLNPK